LVAFDTPPGDLLLSAWTPARRLPARNALLRPDGTANGKQNRVLYPGAALHQGLEIMELSDNEWRICDAAMDENDATRVLGFLEQRAGYFELTSMNRPHRRERFGSFDSAIAAMTIRTRL
jgi:hypothetical protein